MIADILVELAEKRAMFSQSLPSFFYKVGEVKKQEKTDGERLDSSSKAGEVEPVVQKRLRA